MKTSNQMRLAIVTVALSTLFLVSCEKEREQISLPAPVAKTGVEAVNGVLYFCDEDAFFDISERLGSMSEIDRLMWVFIGDRVENASLKSPVYKSVSGEVTNRGVATWVKFGC